MEKESLLKARKRIIEAISMLEPITDRVELMVNLMHFLDDEKYEENIKVLKLQFDKKK